MSSFDTNNITNPVIDIPDISKISLTSSGPSDESKAIADGDNIQPAEGAGKEENSISFEVDAKSVDAVAEVVIEERRYTKSIVPKIDNLSARQTQHLSSGITFDDPSLNIPRPLLDALIMDLRFEKPSEIQACAIPRIVQGKNLIAQAQTGSGKTIAFAVGMLSKVDVQQPTVQALCLAPSRELADQIIKLAIEPLTARMPGIRYELLVSDDKGKQTRRAATCTAHVIVGTPGKVKDLINRKYLRNLERTLKIFVCDEADTMVDQAQLGQDTLAIYYGLAPGPGLRPACQTLFFSATYTPQILEFCRKIVVKASVIKLKRDDSLVLENIIQVRIDVNKRPNTGENKKLQILQEIYTFFDIEQSIVFVSTKREAAEVSGMFRSASFTVSHMSGDLQPSERDAEMDKFRRGETKVLVATNLLSRGVDVPSVDLIVNYDLPTKQEPMGSADPLTYLHRMGRCGRFGRPGTLINFLQRFPDDDRLMYEIENHFGKGQPENRMTLEWDANSMIALDDLIKQRVATVTATGSPIVDGNLSQGRVEITEDA